jgi:UDP-glucuronate 4-epimerase
MRALVTGGAGFIGSSLADRLLRDGWEVSALDNFDPYYDPAQKRRNVAAAARRSEYRLIEGDVRDPDALLRAFDEARPDVVMHLAARAGVRTSVEDPASYVEVNERGGLNVLMACVQRDRTPLVFASTSSVYGNTSSVPFREDDAAVEPLSPYAASKRAAELMVYAYHHLHQLPVAVLRFFTVYGPRGRPDMAFAKFTRALRQKEAIWLHGEETERDFTYIDDIVDGVVGAFDWVRETRGLGTFNLGRTQPVRVRRLIELMAKELGAEPIIRLGELQPGESRVTAADVTRARDAFGYEPKMSLEEGIRRWVQWVDESGEAPEELRRG